MEEGRDRPPVEDEDTPAVGTNPGGSSGTSYVDSFPPRIRSSAGFLKSFVFAYLGILQVLASQRSMVVHCIIAIPTLAATQLLDFEPVENIVVLLCVALVLGCELINTATEELCDLVQPGYHPAIRRVKDAAAGMVLIGAIASAAIGVILFTSHDRLGRFLHWDVTWSWGGSIDEILVKLILLGHCWLFVHVWIYRRRSARKKRQHPTIRAPERSQ